MTTIIKKHVGVAFLGALGCLAMAASAHAAEMTGAGSTFVNPVAAKWAEAYKAATGNSLNYQSIGSGSGIQQIEAKTVDFGASDAPLSVKDLSDNGLIQFPMVEGGVVPVVNIPGVKPGELVLNGPALADIFQGKITKWNDPALTKLNPDLKLPNTAIAVVHRSNSSGTSFLFTSYLADVSADWKSKIGAGTAVEWPVGTGGKGSEGVAATAGQIPGSIGYVEYAYSLQNNMTYAKLINHDGVTVSPSLDTFTSAASNADWAHTPGFGAVTVNQPGKASWPITGATFAIMHTTQDKAANGVEVLKFIDWTYKNGIKMAQDLAYVPIPTAVVTMIEDNWSKNIKGADGKAIWPAK